MPPLRGIGPVHRGMNEDRQHRHQQRQAHQNSQ